jgi:hypothetical protein
MSNESDLEAAEDFQRILKKKLVDLINDETTVIDSIGFVDSDQFKKINITYLEKSSKHIPVDGETKFNDAMSIV